MMIEILVLGSAWIAAAGLSTRWKKGVFVPLAAMFGCGAGGFTAFSLGLLLSYADPDYIEPGEVVIYTLQMVALSAVVALVAAVVGWRRARHPVRIRTGVAPVKGAFDNLNIKP